MEGVEYVDFNQVHAWLKSAYWSPDISLEKVERAAKYSSLVISAWLEDTEVGYLRVVSDRSRFAYICDLFVAESHRGQGVAKSMVRYALDHPEHQNLRRWLLATKDAHSLYEGFGFQSLSQPERWMAIQD